VGAIAEGDDPGAVNVTIWVNVTLEGAGSLVLHSPRIFIDSVSAADRSPAAALVCCIHLGCLLFTVLLCVHPF
jgi:hypothetical protein